MCNCTECSNSLAAQCTWTVCSRQICWHFLLSESTFECKIKLLMGFSQQEYVRNVGNTQNVLVLSLSLLVLSFWGQWGKNIVKVQFMCGVYARLWVVNGSVFNKTLGKVHKSSSSGILEAFPSCMQSLLQAFGELQKSRLHTGRQNGGDMGLAERRLDYDGSLIQRGWDEGLGGLWTVARWMHYIKPQFWYSVIYFHRDNLL